MLACFGCRYVPEALDTVRVTVHNDRDALYVFQLQYDGFPNTLPDMVVNGEVRRHRRTLCFAWTTFVSVGYPSHLAVQSTSMTGPRVQAAYDGHSKTLGSDRGVGPFSLFLKRFCRCSARKAKTCARHCLISNCAEEWQVQVVSHLGVVLWVNLCVGHRWSTAT